MHPLSPFPMRENRTYMLNMSAKSVSDSLSWAFNVLFFVMPHRRTPALDIGLAIHHSSIHPLWRPTNEVLPKCVAVFVFSYNHETTTVVIVS